MEMTDKISDHSGDVDPIYYDLNNLQLQGDSTETTQNVTFTDNAVGSVTLMPKVRNPVAISDSTSDLSLEEFLARPIVIHTETWDTSDPVGVLFNIEPWELYLDSTSIKKKLDNFGFLRAKLHIKVVLNATPFQYGLARMCYSPLEGEILDKITTYVGSEDRTLIPYSQQPGFYIHPQCNSGGEMELPFVYHKNWLDITVRADVGSMGNLRCVIYDSLKKATSAAPDEITIQTLAWMTDVELMATTSKLALQSDDDEYGNRPISKPAAAIASAASLLTDIPVIGPFARATQIGASVISTIASAFGYTNPPNIDNVAPMNNMNLPHLATAEISVPFQKLTLDPKQELSLDTSTYGGSNQDELSIAYLKERESYFHAFNWQSSDAVDTIIFNTNILPNLYDYVELGTGTPKEGLAVYHTPLSYLSELFLDWRGTIKIRIKAVCTKFHKGRLRICFDPINDISTTVPAASTVYTHFLDISQSDDVTIEIPYHQATAWRRLTSDKRLQFNDGTTLTADSGSNGMLSISVFSELSSPDSTAEVNVMVYISAGEDFEYANPRGSIGKGTTYANPSLFQLQGEDICSEEPATCRFGNGTKINSERYHQNYGESFLSLRKLLHRSTLMDVVPFPAFTAVATNLLLKSYQRMPYANGWLPNSWPTQANRQLTVGTDEYAFNNIHPLTYVSAMFVGYRGGVNYSVTFTSPNVILDHIKVSRSTEAVPFTSSKVISNTGNITLASNLATTTRNLNDFDYKYGYGNGGTAVTTHRNCNGLLFNIPDYNIYNFSLMRFDRLAFGSSVDGTNRQTVNMLIPYLGITGESPNTSMINSYAGAAPDFTCVFYVCCPTMFYTNTLPTAV